MSFASLKKKSGSFDKLTQQIEKMSKPQGAGPDERLWKPGVDKSGNGYAVIRFLPEPEGEDLPWAQVWATLSKVLADGILKTPSPHWVRKILLVN